MKMIKIFILPFIILLFYSCNEDDLITFEGKDQIYFDDLSANTNVRKFTFSVTAEDVLDTIFYFKIKATGKLNSADRKFIISYDRDSTTAVSGEDFILPAADTCLIQAGTDSKIIGIKILRTSKIKDTSISLALTLLQNENFDVEIFPFVNNEDNIPMKGNTFTFIFDDIFLAPDYWADVEFYYGPFSKKKYMYMANLMGGPDDLEYWSLYYPDQVADVVNFYLQSDPQIDEDGLPMKMGPYIQ